MSMVMSNRMSWRKFDQISTLDGHLSSNQTPTRKRSHCSDENTPPVNGSPADPDTLADILTEAQTWSTDEKVNWSTVRKGELE